MEVTDGLVNITAGLGTARDKGAGGYYQIELVNEAMALAAYKSSSLAQRIIDMPAEDSCREWREWNADQAQISAIEKEEKRLGLQAKVLRAQKIARLFGGSALIIGTGDQNPSLPLNPETIGIGGIKYITVLTRRDISPQGLETDYTSENFGKPSSWNMNTATNNGIAIHPSRVVVFSGREPLGQYDQSDNLGWGDSVLQGGIDAVKRVDAVAGNVLSLIYEAKIDVLKIKDLMTNIASRGADYEQALMRRLTLAAMSKGNNGMMILDATEEYEQKSASFGSLDSIMDRFMQLTCAAYGIPMTLLFGTSPGGLNATGDSDTRAYYDRIKVVQSLQIEPAMKVLDECLIRSALGNRPDNVFYNWRSLWQMGAKEKAEVGKIIADTASALDKMGIIPAEAVSKSAVSALTENGSFPGLESNVEEFGGIMARGETVEPSEEETDLSA